MDADYGDTEVNSRLDGSGFFGTKAETLERLAPHQGYFQIPEFLYFKVSEWEDRADDFLSKIESRFGSRSVAVRSSARDEDTELTSSAGLYTSVIGVPADDASALRVAISKVILSFGKDRQDDQVLIQLKVANIDISGVAVTHGLDDGSPYYTIEYDDESGVTDSVTAGLRINKLIRLHRDVGEARLTSPRMRRLLRFIRNIEGIVGRFPIDIEFALDKGGNLHLFQVRQIASRSDWGDHLEQSVDRALNGIADFLSIRLDARPGILGRYGIISTMSDWNPAEMIGSAPRRLAFSLYRHLITNDVWALTRKTMGYRSMVGHELMVGLAGRPYIDVRNSFNSFLPAALDEALAERLINAALDRLAEHPALHDKVEFEVMPTGLDFRSEAFLATAYGDVLTLIDRRAILDAYREHMNALVGDGRSDTLTEAERCIVELGERQSARGPLSEMLGGAPLQKIAVARQLIEEVKLLGTTAFAVLARHAFLSEALLRSLVDRGAMTPDRVLAFKMSIETVATDLAREIGKVNKGEVPLDAFLSRFGHLRPGTYDILSPRYDQRAELFQGTSLLKNRCRSSRGFTPTPNEKTAIESLLNEAGLRIENAEALFSYARRSIIGRELGKFVFTRNISDALEVITAWAESRSLSTEGLSHIEIELILNQAMGETLDTARTSLQDQIDEGRQAHQCGAALQLGFILRSAEELYIAPVQRSEPNYVTKKRASGHIIALTAQSAPTAGLTGAIVCIESADPGYDWIFTHGIVGLVTKYGGANSHMAIRCVEFGVPAAIGCGEVLFERIARGGYMEIDAGNRKFELC